MSSLRMEQKRVDEFAQAKEIVPNQLYFTVIKRSDSPRTSPTLRKNIAFSIDEELIYEAFYADFGPLNLAHVWRFATKLENALKLAQQSGNKKVYFYAMNRPDYKANACVLMGTYQILYLDASPQEAYQSVSSFGPFLPYRDASCGASTFNLTVADCLKGIHKAKAVNFLDFQLRDKSTFNLNEYEFYEQVENGDFNWIVPNKFLAFSGPTSKREPCYGFYTRIPEDYVDYFNENNVKAVIRLNNKMYDRRRFIKAGIQHFDLYFPDGSCPPDDIRRKFLEICESVNGAIAVHCKAGLGRTGVLIACYMMKHFSFTARGAIGYIRTCRPGSIIGPQQHYLCDVEKEMNQAGEDYRMHSPRRTTEGSRSPRRVPELKISSSLLVGERSPVSPLNMEDKERTTSFGKQRISPQSKGRLAKPFDAKAKQDNTMEMSTVLKVLPHPGLSSPAASPKSPSQRHVAVNGQPRKLRLEA